MKENINFVAGLSIAQRARYSYPIANQKGKASIVKQLGLVPFLTVADIARITGSNIPYIRRTGEPAEGWYETQLLVGEPAWDAGQLDALILIAAQYADDNTINTRLINTIISQVPFQTITRLTGIPLTEIRKAVYGTPTTT